MATTGEKRLDIWLYFTGFSDNGGNNVLFDGRRGPEEFTCPAVEGVDDPGLTGDTGEDLPPLAFFYFRIYPTHLAWVRTDRCVNQDAFKGVVDIPMIDQVLVIPNEVEPLAAVFPDQLTCSRIHCLYDVPRIRQVHEATINQRHGLLQARRHSSAPDHAQRADIFPVDLVERTVPPTIQRAPPH